MRIHHAKLQQPFLKENTRLRFVFLPAYSPILWMLGTGFFIITLFEGLLPLLDIHVGPDNEGLLVGWIFVISTLLCIGLFGWYFGGPIGFIMAWIHQLSQDNYKQPAGFPRIYTRKGKLRM
ncbi:hypothetical protein ABU162_24970 [Paenibacillus thiaminolyticus]